MKTFFNSKHIVEQAIKQKKITISGLYGSSRTLLINELAHERCALFISEYGKIERYGRELTKLIPQTIIIDEENQFYVPSDIIVTTRDFLEKPLRIKEKIELSRGAIIDVSRLLQRLHATGYTREDIVEEEKDYALRGGILDIYEPQSIPVRIEFYGDTINSIRRFDTQTQRSIEHIEKAKIVLATLGDAQLLTQLLDKDTIVVSEGDIDLGFPTVILADDGEIKYHCTPARTYFGDFKTLQEDIKKKKYTFTFLVPTTLVEKLHSLLGEIETYPILVEEGFVDETNKIVYLTETEIFGEMKRKKFIYRGPFIDDLMGLKQNDYVVHSEYGIGQFQGLTLIDIEERKVECLQINYAGQDKVYLPVERLNLLERYISSTDTPPRLSKLGSELWLKTKRKVKQATERLAIDLLNLYSRRMHEEGFSFSEDMHEMKELEASFPYEETEDQMKAISDVKKDMESLRPAERLICGDVGYGKTEIALRAAFKATFDSKQTMILCPTTLLAFQHYNTFKKRLEPFPITVEMVSRFRTKAELKEILSQLASGKIDIVIGTHRLLTPDVQCEDLGLLVIDEEQRFGVAQKEKIKNLRIGVDVIYLSATPIPRTLYMALTGLKDISNIYTPPAGRKDIITKIIYYDDEEIKKIIQFEIERSGQVFFVHNRIQTIETVLSKLQKLLPNLKICLLHGQMREDITAKRMVAFLRGEYDILLSTAIVESGLDMPRVNTIIVDQAHTFGLADLHQLRGRVGRSTVQGHAYFIIPSRYRITDEAHKRLGALSSYTSLGSGFRLALRDMEIRGFGNLLGKEQSGHVNSIGYHHYIRLLGESVGELKGKKVVHEPLLDLKMEAYFPDSYIQSAYERTALYKRLLDVESKHELGVIKNEIVDRFGRYPDEVENLFILSLIRLVAKEHSATQVVRKGNDFVFYKEGKVIHTLHAPKSVE
jgi:transcription-repair coupling factor